MDRYITVMAIFEVKKVDDVRRISKLCSKDDNFTYLSISGITDPDFDKVKQYIEDNGEKELPI